MARSPADRVLSLAGAVGRTIAPVFFGRRPTFRTPVRGLSGELISKANIVANQIQMQMGQQAIEMLRAIAAFQDEATDLVGALPAGDRTKAINQIQEIFDLPVFAYTEAWVKTIEVIIASNKAAIASSRRRKK